MGGEARLSEYMLVENHPSKRLIFNSCSENTLLDCTIETFYFNGKLGKRDSHKKTRRFADDSLFFLARVEKQEILIYFLYQKNLFFNILEVACVADAHENKLIFI